MTYVMIGLRRSGKCLPTLFACANSSFLPFRLFFHCANVLSSCVTSSEVMLPGSSLLLSPFLQKGGMEVGGLGMPLCCFPGVFLSSRSTWSSGRGGGASGCAFGAHELTSVSSVHSWTGDPGVALLRRTPATCFVPVGSPSSSLHARRGVGEVESSVFFFHCSRLPFLPHLCTLGEVVGRVGRPSAAPIRVLPGLPIFSLGSREGTLTPLLVELLSCAVLLLTLSLCLPCSAQR